MGPIKEAFEMSKVRKEINGRVRELTDILLLVTELRNKVGNAEYLTAKEQELYFPLFDMRQFWKQRRDEEREDTGKKVQGRGNILQFSAQGKVRSPHIKDWPKADRLGTGSIGRKVSPRDGEWR